MCDKEKKEGYDNFVKIYANDDKKMRELGHILTNPTSRQIYQILIDNELTATEIGKIIENKEEPKIQNIIYHLNKMVNLHLITKDKKYQEKNNRRLYYYKAVPFILLIPGKHYARALKSKTLQTAFRKVFKFLVIGTPTIITFLITDLQFFYNSSEIKHVTNLPFLLAPVSVLGISLVAAKIILYLKKKFLQTN